MIRGILIEDHALIRQLLDVQRNRRDGTITKTCKDLLREYLTEIRVNGDPVMRDSVSAAPSPSNEKLPQVA
jgi:hypothetical protein